MSCSRVGRKADEYCDIWIADPIIDLSFLSTPYVPPGLKIFHSKEHQFMLLKVGDLDNCLSFANSMFRGDKLQMLHCEYGVVNPSQQFRHNDKGQYVVWGDMCLTATKVRLFV